MGEEKFALYLLFPCQFTIDTRKVSDKISSISKDQVEITRIMGLDTEEALHCQVKIGDEDIKLIGIDSPIPEEITRYTIDCAYGSPKELKAIRKHEYHVIAFYEGESKDMNVIFNLYAKLAYGFLEQNLLGVVNTYSWNVLTPLLINGMAENEEAKKFACTPEMMVWRNFIKIPHEEGVWFVTKGNNLYDVYEFAYYGSFDESQEVYNMFECIFYYAYETKTEIVVEDTLQIEEGVCLRFKEVGELEEILQGDKKGTLVLEKIDL